MPHIEKHAPGSFCWIELATSDQNAAKDFYGSLFGWAANDMPMGPNDFYTIFRLEGYDAAAAYTLRPEQRSQGMPPHWMLYVAVESADAAAPRAAELGGTVIVAPFDVFDAGRMAVVRDPAGACFCVWQAKKNIGVGIAGADGTFCWADLSTPDRAGAGKFYSGLFGWSLTLGEGKTDPSGYLHIKNGEEYIGGVLPDSHRNPNAPPHWLPYFRVADCDGSVDRAKQLGANLCLPPMTIENQLRFAVLTDPQGAVFAVIQRKG
jgi:hypothetical protein